MKIASLFVTRRTASALLASLAFSATLAMASDVAPTQVKFVTSEGDFVVELYPETAPKTVHNFLQYVSEKYYDGTIFHRVINNFMVQGGGYTTTYAEKKAHSPVVHEGREAIAKGGQKNVVGTLAMARTNDPNSASSQFFINVNDNASLNPTAQAPGYTVFGKVISGMDVIDKIKVTPTGSGGPFPTDVPKKQIVIKSATLVKAELPR
ncbi:peptidyl-prolyl cis-trans isomerase [Polaromonas sp.]|nr:peptidyl-prolyl cis-trans isomerase [Polaromonas sp.]